MQKILDILDFFETVDVPLFAAEVSDDEEYRVIGVNPAHARITGLSNAELQGKGIREIVSPRTAEVIITNYRRCIDSRKSYTYNEETIIGKKSTTWRTNLTPIFEGGRIIAILGVAIDVTGDQELQRRLADLSVDVSQSNQALRSIVRTLAHDLRAPVRQAAALADLLMHDFKDLGDNKVEYLMAMRGVLLKSLDLIDNRINASSSEAKVIGIYTEVDLQRWFSDLFAMLDPLKRFQIEYPIDRVECELFILDIALRNLIENAIKHANTKILVSLKTCDGRLRFIVCDDGPGFDPETFEVGRLDPDRLTRSEGVTGRGLVEAVKLVEARGGEVRIEEPSGEMSAGCVSVRVGGRLLSSRD